MEMMSYFWVAVGLLVRRKEADLTADKLGIWLKPTRRASSC